jgi:hypothetical protein
MHGPSIRNDYDEKIGSIDDPLIERNPPRQARPANGHFTAGGRWRLGGAHAVATARDAPVRWPIELATPRQ